MTETNTPTHLDIPIDLDAATLCALSETTAAIIKEKYPNRPHLTAKEVADVWKGETTRSAVNGIRDRLVAGTLIPGLTKKNGRWVIPTAALIRVIDDLVDQVREAERRREHVHPRGPASLGPRRRNSSIGPRPGINTFVEQSAAAWREVFEAWDVVVAEMDRTVLEDTVPETSGKGTPQTPSGGRI